MSYTRLAPLALAAAALAVAGCGKSSTSTTAATTAATQPAAAATSATSTSPAVPVSAALRAKVNAICRRANAQYRSVNSVSQTQGLSPVATRVAAFYQHAATELASLQPPTALAGDWKTLVASYQTIAAKMAALGEYAKAASYKPPVAVVSELLRAHESVVIIGRKQRFKDCEPLK
jgi:hypothetical protein